MVGAKSAMMAGDLTLTEDMIDISTTNESRHDNQNRQVTCIYCPGDLCTGKGIADII